MTTIYARARAEIERRGWRWGPRDAGPMFTEDADLDPDEPCCLVEAFQLVTEDATEWGAARDAALFHLWEHDDQYDGSLMGWNDAPGRTVEQVYALLDQLDAEANA